MKYIPDGIPKESFNIKKFVGTMEISDINHNVQTLTEMNYGMSYDIIVSEECTTTTFISEVPCTHGGEHGIGEQCNPPYINDAYLQITSMTECHNVYTYVFVGGSGGGGGSTYQTAKQIFFNNLTPQQQNYMTSHPIEANELYYFLELKGYGNGSDMAKEIIDSAINSTLVFSFPFFKYPSNSNYATLYPKLTEYLKNKIPALKNNQFIINKLKEYSELTQFQIINDLAWGKGPTIQIVQLDNYCENCNSDVYGLFKSSTPNILYLDIDLVLALENSQQGPQGNSLAFLLGVTILHQYVHPGDNIDGEDQPYEEGNVFEEETYGETVGYDNAGNLLVKWQQ